MIVAFLLKAAIQFSAQFLALNSQKEKGWFKYIVKLLWNGQSNVN